MIRQIQNIGLIFCLMLVMFPISTIPVLAENPPRVSIVLNDNGTATSQTSFQKENGATFTVDIICNTSLPVRAFDITLAFPADKLEIGTPYSTNVRGGDEAGYMLKDWANQRACDVIKTNGPVVNNTNGTVRIGYMINSTANTSLSDKNSGPSGQGRLFSVIFKAKQHVNNVAVISVSNVKLVAPGNEGTYLPAATVSNAIVTIGTNNSTSPIITGVMPLMARAGASVTITGNNFTGVTGVSFGGTAAASFNVNSANQINAVVANGTSGDISVISASGTGTYPGFVFIPPPVITEFTPDRGYQGGTILITGTNLKNSNGSPPTVQIGGVEATSVIANSTKEITAVIGSGKSGEVRVITDGGTAARDGFTFYGEPTISSFQPLSARPGDAVTITGTNFSPELIVKFGGQTARSRTVNSDTSVTAIVGDNAVSGEVSVSTAAGTAVKSGFILTTPTASPTPSASPKNSPAPSPSPTSTSTVGPSTQATPVITPTPSMRSRDRSTSTNTPVNSQPIATTKSQIYTQAPQIYTQVASSQIGDSAIDLSMVLDRGGIIQQTVSRSFRYGTSWRVGLEISRGTRALTAEGKPLESIIVQLSSNLPQAPAGHSFTNAFEFGPSGATFSSPILVVFEYDPANLAKDLDPESLALVYFDNQEGRWKTCDFSLDTVNHRITANISHFSLYAVMGKSNFGIMGVGWSTAAMIIIGELLIAALIGYFLLTRKTNRAVPVGAETLASEPVIPVKEAEYREKASEKSLPPKESTIIWEDLLKEKKSIGLPFNTNLEIIGGKIKIPRDGTSADIELVNLSNTRIIVCLEYDPEHHPKGSVKIMVTGTVNEFEKSKERGQ